MHAEDRSERVVGTDRVLAVLVELARHPDGVSLEDVARRLHSPKPTVHRALSSLGRAGLAARPARGVYVLGDEFIRLAYEHQAARSDVAAIEPVLRELAERYGETAHFAVLDGADVVYRAKVDPPAGSVRLTSMIGGRNPAHRTAVGKLLLSDRIGSEDQLRAWLGARPLEARTPRSITTVPALWSELERTKERGYAVDDQENELDINCIALPVRVGPGSGVRGAVSVSALAFRLPLERLIEELPSIRAIVQGSRADAEPRSSALSRSRDRR